MLSLITCDNGVDPTVVVGGVVNNLGTNSVNGKSDYVVAEADESDGSFLKFRPYLAVITNIENDHLDHYGTEEKIQEAFQQFVDQVKEQGKAILCYDNEKVRRVGEKTATEVISYGIDARMRTTAPKISNMVRMAPTMISFSAVKRSEKAI